MKKGKKKEMRAYVKAYEEVVAAAQSHFSGDRTNPKNWERLIAAVQALNQIEKQS